MTRPVRVLIACERSGVLRDAFRDLGHEAWSSDLAGVEPGGRWKTYHLIGDCRLWLDGTRATGTAWDLLIAHPDCRYLCSSGLHWNTRRPGREASTRSALDFVRALMDAPIPHICIENPIGRIGTAIRPADQYVQPYEYGDDASKRTGLWLKNLPTLRADRRRYIEPRIVKGRPRWANQTDSGQNRLGPSDHRADDRARTYPGIASAMARQWSRYITEANR
jgi:hypothetical protein